MQIIVPTDFSDCANKALSYALAFAQQCRATTLLLLHVLPNVGPTLGRVPTDTIKQDMEEDAADGYSNLRLQLNESGIQYECKTVHESSVADALKALPEAKTDRLVIMGTNGASGLQKALLGSNTVDAINHTDIPVLAVPQHAVPGKIRSLVYASDLIQTEAELRKVLPFAQALGAAINILHIPMPGEILPEYAIHEEELQRITGHIPLTLSFLQGPYVIDALEHYYEEHKSDLLVMFTHQTSFLEQLFERSFTREIAWHGRIPLLVIKRTLA